MSVQGSSSPVPSPRRSVRKHEMTNNDMLNALSDGIIMIENLISKFNSVINCEKTPDVIDTLQAIIGQAQVELDRVVDNQHSQSDPRVEFYVGQVDYMIDQCQNHLSPRCYNENNSSVDSYASVTRESNHNSRPIPEPRSNVTSSVSVGAARQRILETNTSLDLEGVKIQAEIIAQQRELEAQLEQSHMKLAAAGLEIKQRKIQARAEILDGIGIDDREDIIHSLDEQGHQPQSIASPRSYLFRKPTPSPRQRPNHDLDVKVTPMKLVTIDTPENKQSDMQILAESLTRALTSQKVPIPEPHVFGGNPLDYPVWKSAFTAYMSQVDIPDNSKIHYLLKYVSHHAAEAISNFALIPSHDSYMKALRTLNNRFGSDFVVAEAFRHKLDSFHRIRNNDSEALRKYSDFLAQCEAAMHTIHDLSVLNDPHTNIQLCNKLPDWLATKWKQKIAEHRREYDGAFPRFSAFARLVRYHADIQNDPVVASMNAKQGDDRRQQTSTQRSKNTGSTFVAGRNEKPICICCDKPHSIRTCWEFEKWDNDRQYEFITANRLCFRCLDKGHMKTKCIAKVKCNKANCEKPHASSRHDNILKRIAAGIDNKQSKMENPSKQVGGRQPSTSKPDIEIKPNDATTHAASSKQGLSSMIVPVFLSSCANPSCEILVYAMLDTMSDTTFVTQDATHKLNIPGRPTKLSLTTMNGIAKHQNCNIYDQLAVRGFRSNNKINIPRAYSTAAIPLDRSHIPSAGVARAWPHLYSLAHEFPTLDDCPVSLLIGYDVAKALVPIKTIIGSHDNDPYAVQTPLGWCIVGETGQQGEHSHANVKLTLKNELATNGEPSAVTFQCESNSKSASPRDLITMLSQDFTDNQNRLNIPMSKDDKLFLSVLEDNITKDEEGNVFMSLPFVSNSRPIMPNNREIAEKRLANLKIKLSKDPQIKADYLKFMNEIISAGDAELIRDPGSQNRSDIWYLPHFGVYHKQKKKVRVVYDAASRYKGVSLNDKLLQGPDLMNRLTGILHRFRKGKVAVMCDIQKMFHRFKVAEKDRDYLRFLWYSDDSLETVVEYRMCVHLFGAKSSPGCATFGLRHIADTNHDPNDKYSVMARDIIHNEFYVDDGLFSLGSPTDVINVVQSAVKICELSNVRLHKFVSNNKEVLESIPSTERSETLKDLDLQGNNSILPTERALGVKWSVESDCFKFTQKPQESNLPTRRNILSRVASVFDPLGFLAPVILEGKKVLQDTCRNDYGWDDPLNPDIVDKWQKWESDLANLDQVSIPRGIYPLDFGPAIRTELHHFCDASSSGYGQCSYLRIINAERRIHVTLLGAKARVIPANKSITIRRSELQAAVLSCKMAEQLRNDLKLPNIDSEIFWTDSTVVLGYIQNTKKAFHIYVANRVQQIHDLSNPSQWFYVPSKKNPADIASRGSTVYELTQSIWFNGPQFLWDTVLDNMVRPLEHKVLSDDPEVKATCNVIHNATGFSMCNMLSKFSTLKSASRAISFLQNMIRKKQSKPILTEIEKRQAALREMINRTQLEQFGEEHSEIASGKISKRNKLAKLDPFIDNHGTLRVGGRLALSDLPFEEKHPVILPKFTALSMLVIRQSHENTKHQGRDITLADIRSSGYWILGANVMTKSVLHSCVVCRKLRGELSTQKMADLPPERVSPSPMFTYVGTDCFGPFVVKDNRKETKRYGVVFTCMASRAIHIEVVNDMTTDSFINALRCLISIRGPIRKLFSDRGTNFIGANNEFLKASNFANDNQFQWEFNTPYSSHMGGVWERQIRSIRSVLNGLLATDSTRLDSVALRTLMYEVMAIVNSRPLAAMSDDSTVLSPNQLLTMKSKVILPPPGSFDQDDMYSRKRWRVIQSLANQFWSRWRNQYVNNLQSRQKWATKSEMFEKGDIVLVMNSSEERRKWPLAQITETQPSKDGIIRKVALVYVDSNDVCKKGMRSTDLHAIERPIHKLVFLLRPSVNTE